MLIKLFFPPGGAKLNAPFCIRGFSQHNCTISVVFMQEIAVFYGKHPFMVMVIYSMY